MRKEIEPSERGSIEFGNWNENPEQAEGYTHVVSQVLTDRKPGHTSASARPARPTEKKQTKQSKVRKTANPRQPMAIPNEPQMSRGAGPSQETKQSPPPVAENGEDSESEKTDGGFSMKSTDSDAKPLAVKSASLVAESPIQLRISSFDGSLARPAPNVSHFYPTF